MVAVIWPILLGFAAILVLEVPGLLRKGKVGEWVTFVTLWSLAFFYSLAFTYDWPVPNPSKITEAIFAPVVALIEKLLGGK